MPEQSPKEPFLLITLQDEIQLETLDEPSTPRCYYMNPQNGVAEEVPMGILRKQSWIRVMEDRRLEGTEKILQAVRMQLERLCKNISPEAQAVLREKKPIPLVLLINSEGGRAVVMDDILEIINEVRVRGAETYAYGTVRIMSAAAEIWGMADHRFAMKETRALWHAGFREGDDGKEEPLDAETWEERKRELIEFFSQHATGLHKDACIELLNDEANPELEVLMTGNRLQVAGLAEAAFNNFKELEEAFRVQTGWEGPGLEGAFDPVQNFWAATLDDQLTQRAFGSSALDENPDRSQRKDGLFAFLKKVAAPSKINPQK